MNQKAPVSAADYSLTPTAVQQLLPQLAEAGRPAMLWGSPGVGKSFAAQAAAKASGAEFVDVRPLTMDPVDLRGIPLIESGRTRWATPGFLPDPDSPSKHFVCLEELTAAPPSMQAALYQLVWDRRLGDYVLPDGAYVLATGNRISDRGVAHRMPTPLGRRFVHIDIRPDPDEWLDWAIDNHLARQVIFFIAARRELIDQFDPKSEEPTGPCPRTWHMVSNLMRARGTMPDASFRSLLRGTVGEGAAVEFAAFLDIEDDLPMPSTVLADPEGADTYDDRPSVLLALCGSLATVANRDNFGQVCKYAGRIRPEVGQFLVDASIRMHKELEKTIENVRWIARNS